MRPEAGPGRIALDGDGSMMMVLRNFISLCLVSAVALVTAGCGPSERGDEGQEAGSNAVDAGVAPPTKWPLFRGNSEAHGVSPELLELPLRLRWSFDTGEEVTATATIADSSVYVGSTSGVFYALDLASGEPRWSFDTEFAIEGTACVLDRLVIFGGKDGMVYALERDTGELRWKFETSDQILGGVNAWKNDAGETILVVGSYDYFLYGLRAQDGTELWSVETDNFVNGTPTISEGRVSFGGCDGLLHLVDVESGEEISAIEIGAYISNSVAVRDNIAYVAHFGNKVEAFALASGEKVWEFKDRSFEYFASPAVTADRVYAGGRDKRLHCLDRITGEQIWEFEARRSVDSSPVVCPNAIYVGSDDGWLYALDPASGEEIWAYEIGDEVKSSPAIAQRVLVISGGDGVVYAFEGGAESSKAD
ncbi:MAG: PQQ-binding-like beta-propeller repeat protein [Verrucomicrobiales bacterium]